MRRSSIAAVLATVVGVAATDVHAQQWLSDRSLTQGRGIRVGNFELHPGVGAEFGFDSNALYQAIAEPALRLRIAGSFGISTLGQQRTQGSAEATNVPRQTVRFAANVGVSYSHFFGIAAPTAVRSASDASNLGLNAGLSVGWMPSNVFTLNFANTFSRVVTSGSSSCSIVGRTWPRLDSR